MNVNAQIEGISVTGWLNVSGWVWERGLMFVRLSRLIQVLIFEGINADVYFN